MLRAAAARMRWRLSTAAGTASSGRRSAVVGVMAAVRPFPLFGPATMALTRLTKQSGNARVVAMTCQGTPLAATQPADRPHRRVLGDTRRRETYAEYAASGGYRA